MARRFYFLCLWIFATLMSVMSVGNPAAADECGDVAISSMNWVSAELIAEIDSVILSAGYGCNVDVVSGGDVLTVLESMKTTGKPDLAPELWEFAAIEQLDSAVDSGDIVIAGDLLPGGGKQGFWIPHYLAEAHPDIKTVADALERPDLFAANEDGTEVLVHTCPPNWECHIETQNLFNAFGAEDKGFTLANTSSAAALDASIVKAFENEAGWIGYYWAPTALLGRYAMVKLDAGEHDPMQWEQCTAVADCEAPSVNDWPSSRVISVVSDDFSDNNELAMNYVRSRELDIQTINDLLAWIEVNQATGEEAARHFLTEYEDIWSDWVSAEVLLKVKTILL